LALTYVLAMWLVAGGITLWIYLAFSWAPLSDLLAAAARASATAMWLVPGALLLASRSQLAVGAGLVAVILSTSLLFARHVPIGKKTKSRRRRRGTSEPLLFRYQSGQAYVWRGVGPAILAALALQTGIYALSREYPLLAAISFATATAILTAISVARGATEPAAGTPYWAPRTMLTLLLAVTLSAALLRREIAHDEPGAAKMAEMPAVTMRILDRLAHLPPATAPSSLADSKMLAPKAVVTRLVNASPASGANSDNGVPGVVMRPRLKPSQSFRVIAPGVRPVLSPAQALTFPFTGEYHLFRASSGSLPKGAIIQTGTPLEIVYGTTNGAPMETEAVQTFTPPIDLSLCGKIVVTLTSAEVTLLLASIELVTDGSVEDGGTQLIETKPERGQVLEFPLPSPRRSLLVRAIRISFKRPGPDRDKNVQLAVEQFTLMPR
jgi:hypothetical protein